MIFHKNFYPTTVSESDSESVSESELFFSDSDPAKKFGLFRIRIHNTGIRVRIRIRQINLWVPNPKKNFRIHNPVTIKGAFSREKCA
jgi:hypothetical protein